MGRKKVYRIILAVVLVAVIAVGATFAYLTAVTPAVTNVFTFSAGVDGVIQEPGWDDKTWDLDEEDWDEGNTPEEELGRDKAKNIVPGRVIPKDPVLVNTGEIEIYGALEIRFTDGSGTLLNATQMGAINRSVQIDWNWNSDWSPMNGVPTDNRHTVYFNSAIRSWSDPLSTNPLTHARTTPYFRTVTILPTTSDADMAILQAIPGGFQIIVRGAVVQSEGFVDAAAAIVPLRGLFPAF